MKKLIELRKLTKAFYKDYPSNKFPELERKEGRPYVVLVVEIDGHKFAIPLRTNIRHSYCYKFKNSDRETESTTGIDFSKAVIILKDSYLGKETDINDKEYLEIQEKMFFIINKFKRYYDGYKKSKLEDANKHLIKKYKYCTLKYFEKN